MGISRRAFLKGVLGLSAAALIQPDAETVRRFWVGWSPEVALAAPPPVPLDLAGPFAEECQRLKLLLEQAIWRGGRLPTWMELER